MTTPGMSEEMNMANVGDIAEEQRFETAVDATLMAHYVEQASGGHSLDISIKGELSSNPDEKIKLIKYWLLDKLAKEFNYSVLPRVEQPVPSASPAPDSAQAPRSIYWTPGATQPAGVWRADLFTGGEY